MSLLLKKFILFGEAVVADVVTLHGTTGSPILLSYTAFDPADAEGTWAFVNTTASGHARGQVESSGNDVGGSASWTADNSSTDWVVPKDFQDGPYYLRATSYSGDAPTLGNSLNTWHIMSNGGSLVFFTWQHTVLAGGKDGVIKVDISTDVSGTPIVATGYYRCVLDVST